MLYHKVDNKVFYLPVEIVQAAAAELEHPVGTAQVAAWGHPVVAEVPAAVGIDPGVPEGRPVVRVALEEVAEGCRPVDQGWTLAHHLEREIKVILATSLSYRNQYLII